MKKLAFLIVLSTLPVFSWATNITVKSRNYTLSCGYFTSVQADVEVSFQDLSLPWGTEVTLVTGWAGRENFPEKRYEWKERKEFLTRATAPYTWATSIHKVLHNRSEANFRDTLNFVFRISSPGRAPYFVNGGSTWGFYSARLVENSPGRCVSGLNDLPSFLETTVETVTKE